MSGWFYNDVSGTLNRVPTALEAPYLIPGTGWHELTISYNATRAQALAEAAKEFPGSATPGASIASNLGQAAAGGLGNVLGIPHFTSSAWRGYAIRGLKIIAGIVLVIIGVNKLTGASNKIVAVAERAPI